MESLRISDTPTLDTLPDEILLVILSYLTTAQSVSHLALASKRLCRLISTDGWRVFVKNCFYNLSTQSVASLAATDDGWKQLAQRLTAQSRDWDRRAFSFHIFTRQEERQARARNPLGIAASRRSQTVPCHIMVDVHSQVRGREEEETIVWGAGEDIVALTRRKYDNTPQSQRWDQYKGAEARFTAGKDDITSISILRPSHFIQESALSLVVGRASGDLRLLSMTEDKFGHTIRRFVPPPVSHKRNVDQKEIQSLDACEATNLLTAATKDQIILYPINGWDSKSLKDYGLEGYGIEYMPHGPSRVYPTEALRLRDIKGSPNFKFIRSVKFVNDETVAVGLTSSTEPLRYLHITPAGIEILAAPNINQYTSSDFCLGTVRALSPVDTSSVASGGRNTILTSWDDGTVRLQDLRTPSAFDRIYQDNFEPTTPVNSLISYGLERFVGGSARAPVLKIFDFRWSKGYEYTEALPCANEPPTPEPRPPTIVAKPLVVARSRCNYLLGHLCRWHALSKESYYRPNCNIYLPKRAVTDTPIHSLARGSDTSPTLYAGLAGSLVEMNLRSSSDNYYEPENPPLYSCHRAKVNLLETGDGALLSDISQSQRMPIIRAQSERRDDHLLPSFITKRHRLDEWLQDASDFSLLE